MKKNLSIFIILFLGSLQFFSLLHNANYAFQDHDHQGIDCEVFYSNKNLKLFGSFEQSLDIALQYKIIKQYQFEEHFVPLAEYYSFSSRSPPSFV